MLPNIIRDLLDMQVTKELESAYLYLQFAQYFEEQGLAGFGHWYRVQAKEEVAHARKITDYLHDNGEGASMNGLKPVDIKLDSDRSVLHQGLQHEKYVTMLINNIYEEAIKENDYRTQSFLKWFIDEQLEEEANAEALVDNYERFCLGCGCGIYIMDKTLGNRRN